MVRLGSKPLLNSAQTWRFWVRAHCMKELSAVCLMVPLPSDSINHCGLITFKPGIGPYLVGSGVLL
ncbi:hypothetical protein D3C75_1017520 [compost metagenome]